jgi:hypothetical protein
MIMQIKNADKLRKTTLRERIYEEVVHLILSGELPSGGRVDERQVIQLSSRKSAFDDQTLAGTLIFPNTQMLIILQPLSRELCAVRSRGSPVQ